MHLPGKSGFIMHFLLFFEFSWLKRIFDHQTWPKGPFMLRCTVASCLSWRNFKFKKKDLATVWVGKAIPRESAKGRLHHRGLHRGAKPAPQCQCRANAAHKMLMWQYENIVVASTVIQWISEFRGLKAILEYDKLSMICSFNVPQD